MPVVWNACVARTIILSTCLRNYANVKARMNEWFKNRPIQKLIAAHKFLAKEVTPFVCLFKHMLLINEILTNGPSNNKKQRKLEMHSGLYKKFIDHSYILEIDPRGQNSCKFEQFNNNFSLGLNIIHILPSRLK